MRSKIITFCSLLSVFSISAHGQIPGNPGAPADLDPAIPPVEEPVNPVDPPNPESYDPGFGERSVPVEIVSLRDEIRTLRESLQESRQAALQGLGEDYTSEELLAVLDQWKLDNTSVLEEMKALSEELRYQIESINPVGPPAWAGMPEELLVVRTSLREQRLALAESRREVVQDLGENPTPEAVKEAVEKWRADHAEEIAEVQDLGAQLGDWFRENRPERPETPFTPEIAQQRTAMRENSAALREKGQAFAASMANNALTEDDRRELVEAFRAEQRGMMEERKNLARQERANQAAEAGERRPGG